MAGALEDCLVVAGGLEAVEPKRKVFMRLQMFGYGLRRKKAQRSRCQGPVGLWWVEEGGKAPGGFQINQSAATFS